ncbi:MAG: metallophosphoesterase [Chloroflexi bacterium]|nr:metallophosphoesterase [Chloroflexota bacterium]
MKILAISDRVVEIVYDVRIAERFTDVNLVLSCGDLPYFYLEFIVTMLRVPVFYVIGNHGTELQYGPHNQPQYPGGCVNLHKRVIHHSGLIIAGLEGSMRYKERGEFQYTETDMALNALELVPRLIWNRIRYGRYLDILVTHAPPRGIHDQGDLCHQGFKTYLTVMQVFKPRFLIHGHTHSHYNTNPMESMYRETRVINAYGHRLIDVPLANSGGRNV